ncbi:MAG: ABC transporter substrate-binding protein [Proteobacteria bacterium]|nr:ABC transporter substrate-binding protein [Pseudomonadota bacterium]
MRKSYGMIVWVLCAGLVLALIGAGPAAAFTPLKGDMASFDPTKQTFPTSGDTIKIGLFEPFSGPSAISGEIYWLTLGWVAHDINSQGGIKVDGKMKKIQIIKGDTQVKPATAKRVAEKLCLEDKVDVMMGTSGTHINIIGQQTAGKYKKIYMTYGAYSDVLTSKEYFNEYTFRTCWTVAAMSKAIAYYYAKETKIRKFYLLNQDYVYGHAIAEEFTKAIKEYAPDAQIVGSDFHPLFNKDFAPYLEKVKASGAEAIISGNWATDEENLIKQSRQLGLDIPLAGPFFDDYRPLKVIGSGKGKDFAVVFYHNCAIDNPQNNAFVDQWHALWKNWKEPYNSRLYKWPAGVIGGTAVQYYWLFDVMKRAGSTKPEKIKKVWEGDKYKTVSGVTWTMRACDHQALRDIPVSRLDFPNKWQDDVDSYTKPFMVPEKFCEPPIADDMKGFRCK